MFGSIFFKRKMFFVQEGKMIWKSSKSRQRWILAGFIFELLVAFFLIIILNLNLYELFIITAAMIEGSYLGGSVIRNYGHRTIGSIITSFITYFVVIDGYSLYDSFQTVEINTEKKTIYIIRPKKTRKYSIDDKITIDIYKEGIRKPKTLVRIVYETKERVLKLTPKDPGFRELIDFFEEHFPRRITYDRYRGLRL